jgi:hypothetical protein
MTKIEIGKRYKFDTKVHNNYICLKQFISNRTVYLADGAGDGDRIHRSKKYGYFDPFVIGTVVGIDTNNNNFICISISDIKFDV